MPLPHHSAKENARRDVAMLCLPQEGNEARACPFGSLSVAHPKPGCPLCLPVDMAEAGSDFSVRNPKLLVLMPLHFSDPSCHCFHCTQFALCSGEMSLELVLSSCSDQIVPGICWKCSPRSALFVTVVFAKPGLKCNTA